MLIRSAREIWETALGELQIEVSKSNYCTWFSKTTGISFENGKFAIGVPNTFIAEYLEQNQSSLIERVLAGILRSDLNLEFRIVTGNKHATTEQGPLPLFNPRYTFEKFVVGNSNNLAYAAARKVAEQPGESFNPLYIYGATGLGKTHLLQAIGNEASNKNFKVICVSAEQYTNEMVASIREKTTDDFRRKFRTVDLLLLDDIQFLTGKEQTEESFFHTFNELHSNNHQVVITSDRPPKAIDGFKNRLLSRMEWGLVADLQSPELETRIGILKAKAERDGVELKDDVLEFLALQVKENIRVLEGSLNRVIAYARLLNTKITPDVAARAIDNLSSMRITLAPVTPGYIMETVAGFFRLSLSDIKGRRRDEATTLARQTAMYLIREETDCSLANIGKEIGGRSPATISYAHEKMATALNNDAQLRRWVSDIRVKLHTPLAN
jgi:chromosomal replication initiator protein